MKGSPVFATKSLVRDERKNLLSGLPVFLRHRKNSRAKPRAISSMVVDPKAVTAESSRKLALSKRACCHLSLDS
jgi:hypothetical protein